MSAPQRRRRPARDYTPAEAPAVRPGCRFYVTVRSGPRTGLLLGPYASHIMALANVSRGGHLAEGVDPWAHAYAYGTASLPISRKTVFGR